MGDTVLTNILALKYKDMTALRANGYKLLLPLCSMGMKWGVFQALSQGTELTASNGSKSFSSISKNRNLKNLIWKVIKAMIFIYIEIKVQCNKKCLSGLGLHKFSPFL